MVATHHIETVMMPLKNHITINTNNAEYSLSLFQCLLRQDGWFTIHILPTSYRTTYIYCKASSNVFKNNTPIRDVATILK